ncbi:hypothetical protein [Nocardiopsis sp. ATB16-24]|uniref:hypothetical protein n=1 Tax=Nocardiopsis sp. ATB16-24 TaxID=3019555 RepID=UPI0025545483|nr:hypothetical protein [Nocardiopsis sp. ATB16-24]
MFGGFHENTRDTITKTRSARNVPDRNEIEFLSLNKKKGATWYETLLVDEALHAVFIRQAKASISGTTALREEQECFVDRVTLGAREIIESKVTIKNVVEAHVWCSIVSEFLAGLSPHTASSPISPDFAAICYPRKTKARTPTSLAEVRERGLQHLSVTFSTTRDIPDTEKLALLRLVGAATCPDLWRHAAAVRYCLAPFVQEESWPPENTTKVAVLPDFRQLQLRWSRRGHW